MMLKRTQVVHVNKGNDKIIIAQLTHDNAKGLMTLSKAKLTFSLLTKQTSEFAYLLKPVRMHDEHQPLITLVSLGVKSHSPRSRGKRPSFVCLTSTQDENFKKFVKYWWVDFYFKIFIIIFTNLYLYCI